MVDARTKSIAFFELFSQGLSVPKCHFRSDEIVEIWGTLPNSVQDVFTDQKFSIEVVKVETTPFYEVWTVVMHLFWL